MWAVNGRGATQCGDLLRMDRQRVVQPGRGRPHRSNLISVAGVQQVAVDLALQGHRDPADLDLMPTVQCGDRSRDQTSPVSSQDVSRATPARRGNGLARPTTSRESAGCRAHPSQRVVVAHHDLGAGVDADAPLAPRSVLPTQRPAAAPSMRPKCRSRGSLLRIAHFPQHLQRRHARLRQASKSSQQPAPSETLGARPAGS